MEDDVRKLEIAVIQAECYGLDFVLNCDDTKTLKSVLNYIKQLEKENEELRKGQQSLTQSRKKWKDRYYKLKNRKEG